MADMICVTLRSKIRSEHMSLSLIQILCDDFLRSIGVLCGWFSGFRLWERISLFGVTIADCYKKKNKRKSEQRRDKGEREGGSSIDYIYKELE